MKPQPRSAAVSAIVFSVSAWFAYAMVEMALLFLLDLPFRPTSEAAVNGWSLQWAGLTLLLCLGTGLVMGVASSLFLACFGLVYDWPNEWGRVRVPYALGTLGMLGTMTAHGVYRTELRDLPGVALVIVGVLFIGGILFALVRRSDNSVLTTAANPWVGALCLAGTPWLIGQVSGLGAVAFVVDLIIIIVLAFLLHRLTRVTVPDASVVMFARPAATIGVGVVAWGAMFLAASSPYWRPDEWPRANRLSPSTIVLVVMDTVRGDHTSLLGYERDTTPNLRKLAKQATLYRRTTAPANWTLPSHASMFTGLYPRRHGANDAARLPVLGDPLDDRFTTIAEILQEHGYWSFAAVANGSVVSPENGVAQGFHNFQSRPPVDYHNFLLMATLRMLMDRAPYNTLTLRGPRAGEINRIAYDVLNHAKQRKAGLFLFLNYLDAHEPYVPPAPYDTLFPGKDSSFTRRSYDRLIRSFEAAEQSVSDAEAAAMISQYDGGIRYMDEEIGNLVDLLKNNGQFEDALIIVTSDHGEAFGDHGTLGHSCTLFQEQIGVPLLIKYPHLTAESVVDLNASLVDIMPTILATAGLPVPEGLDGMSLLAPDKINRPSVTAEGYPMPMWRGPKKAVQRAMRKRDLKLTISQTGDIALYDLAADPAEDENIYEQHPEDGQALKEALVLWVETIPAFKGEFRELDSKSLERLRGLGYIQ